MTKVELRKIAQAALKSEYGFAPALNKITLLETNWLNYILFEVGDNNYKFHGRVLSDGTIWVGKGTITKMEEV